MIAQVEDVANKSFDYVIVGGGTAGLVLAARLSKDPSTSVCVLEAGGANLEDAMIASLATYGVHLGQKQYDWGYASVKQKRLADRSMPLGRGRGLGGSSSINYMVWTKPPAEEVDDWERLGNPGWNWKNFTKYAARVERFVEPTQEQRQKIKIPLNSGDIGTDGALAISYPKTFSEVDSFMKESMTNAGIPEAPRPYGGNPNGHHWTINSHDSATATRSYAVTGYYLPNKHRKNLTVLTDALVTKLASEGTTQPLTIKLVEFVYEGRAYVVNVKKEAILSAGAFKSPQLLELSGIGRKGVLEKAGVEVKIDLPGVGENMQEHTFGHLAFALKPEYNFLCFNQLTHPKLLAEQMELYKQLTGVLTMGLPSSAFVPLETLSPAAANAAYAKAKTTVAALDSAATPPGLLKQYKIQLERLEPGKNQVGPACELMAVAGISGIETQEGRSYITYGYGTNHAFSRGYVHITSKDPNAELEIDPRYFEHEVDLDVLVEVAKFCRKLSTVSPISDMIEQELKPGPEVQTEEEWRSFVKQTYLTTWHTCGTCSMLPLSDGGVVDSNLKVYGTTNLRVVDLSIVPLHFAAHTQATVYVIAEQAADIIKGVFTP